MSILEVKDLHVQVTDDGETKEILKGVNLTMRSGEVHAIMGPNGTGKSTLSETIMGNPKYVITQGSISLDGVDLTAESVDQRARAGLFLAMQYPAEIMGVTNAEFMRAAINARRGDKNQIPVREFIQELDRNLAMLKMDPQMAERYLNQGFSGGEKKRNEILQMLMIKPAFAILDEIDSGLDIDALQIVSEGINSMRGPHFGALIITHYQRLLNYVTPDIVHIMMGGKIVTTGDASLAEKLEAEGYEGLKAEMAHDEH